MPQTLRIDNFSSVNILDTTRLTDRADSGTSTLTLRNGDEANNGALLRVGSSDGAEIASVGTSSGNSVTLAAPLKLGHAADEPVQILFGNSIRIYRAPDVNGAQPADGAFTPLATVTIDTDEPSTAYTDNDGGSGFWYRQTFLNATTNLETSLTDSVAVRGGNAGNYATLDEVRHDAGFDNNPYVTDSAIDAHRQSAQSEINSALSGIYTLPFTSPINPQINTITRQLAAGQLMVKEYSGTNPSMAAQGRDLITEARSSLDRIKSGQRVLLSAEGNTLTVNQASTTGTGGVAGGWPNASTYNQQTGEGGSLFGVGKVF